MLVENDDTGSTRIGITSGTSPYPYVELPEVGRVTGLVRLFEDKISGGKSAERGRVERFPRKRSGENREPTRSELR